MKVLQLDDLAEIAVVGGTLRWKPLRRALGVRAFGINAYAADAGADVVEEHDETGTGAGGHEELYLVLRGHATFTVDGEQVDAPPGTVVFLPEPTARRRAVATADGTLVLAIGGEPGVAYEPSAWELWFAAEPLVAAGRHGEAADQILSEGLPEHEGNPALHYNVACQLALAGRGEEAVGQLVRALEADADRVRGWADGDADLDSLRARADWPL